MNQEEILKNMFSQMSQEDVSKAQESVQDMLKDPEEFKSKISDAVDMLSKMMSSENNSNG